MKPVMNQRAVAATIIKKIYVDKRSLSDVLMEAWKSVPVGADRAFIQELCYGATRWFFRLEIIANQLLHKPLKAKDADVFCLLLIGLYQLIYMRVPEYAAVDETVSAAKSLKKEWARGLLNKILRLFIHNKNQYLSVADQQEVSLYSHPAWLIKKIKDDWPLEWESILQANNSPAPMTLRVNQQKTSRENYSEILKKNDIEANKVDGLQQAIQLKKPLPVDKLPGFQEGLCSVQDASGQQIAEILALKPGLRVLDACAAPGSKTCHIMEQEPSLSNITVIDKDTKRLELVSENIERLGLNHQQVHYVASDASEVKTWWDGKLFDRIVIDAPCSGTGVIRRHPDIKILRRTDDIENFTLLQKRLLETLWPLLANEGQLIYSTCSILNCENEQLISRFIESANGSLKQQHQRLPSKGSTDGFYFACQTPPLYQKNK